MANFRTVHQVHNLCPFLQLRPDLAKAVLSSPHPAIPSSTNPRGNGVISQFSPFCFCWSLQHSFNPCPFLSLISSPLLSLGGNLPGVELSTYVLAWQQWKHSNTLWRTYPTGSSVSRSSMAKSHNAKKDVAQLTKPQSDPGVPSATRPLRNKGSQESLRPRDEPEAHPREFRNQR